MTNIEATKIGRGWWEWKKACGWEQISVSNLPLHLPGGSPWNTCLSALHRYMLGQPFHFRITFMISSPHHHRQIPLSHILWLCLITFSHFYVNWIQSNYWAFRNKTGNVSRSAESMRYMGKGTDEKVDDMNSYLGSTTYNSKCLYQRCTRTNWNDIWGEKHLNKQIPYKMLYSNLNRIQNMIKLYCSHSHTLVHNES